VQAQPLSGGLASSLYYDWREQEQFLEFDFEDDCGMNLHTHPRRSDRTLAIFIHGFNGKGYETWAEFPRLLFDDCHGISADVGIFRYDTGFVAARQRTVNVNATINRLQLTIKELAPKFSAIIFFCHSFGGVLGQIAVERYLNDHLHEFREFSSKIAATFFFGSPRAGTRLAPGFLNRIFREFQYLERFADPLTETEIFYNTNVEMEPIANLRKKNYLIPRYACMGSRDEVVEEFSVTFGIPKDRLFYPNLNHSMIVKPASGQARQFIWAREKFWQVMALHRSWLREQAFAIEHTGDASTRATHFITELWPGTTGTQWALMFEELRSEFAKLRTVTGQQVKIHDKADMLGHAYPVDLLISLHSADSTLNDQDAERPIVLEARRRHESVDEPAVGISPVGALAEDATAEMQRWLAPHRPLGQFFIEPAEDDEVLKQLLYNWLKLIVRGDVSESRKMSLGGIRDIVDPVDWPPLGNEGYL
jgi:hypothetical protein